MTDSAPQWRRFVVHARTCKVMSAYVGRLGSHAGLFWNVGDADRCDCGLLYLLRELATVYGQASIRRFSGNEFEESTRLEEVEADLQAAVVPQKGNTK